MTGHALTLGAIPLRSNRCAFRVWAPMAKTVALHLITPTDKIVPMERDEFGYYTATVENVPPGSDYFFRLNDTTDRPDPASRWQPDGVHGASRVCETDFPWNDQSWSGTPLRDYIIYELHVGTFTAEGTFDGVIAHLAELKELGVTTIELLPVAQFPGARNWGYDGASPFAAQSSYGGPAGLKRLVNAAHRHGLAVILDVVYNHLGPEGNYLAEFGPYFTDRHRIAWGVALNYDGPDSDHVRRYFLENALCWQTEFHVDALRLDAVHAICDASAVTFLEELAETCHRTADELNRRFHLIAESDMNMPRHILPRALGGYGLDAQWADDFHHCLHVLATGERKAYYMDYAGVSQLAKTWREGFAFTGNYSPHRKRRHGASPHLNPVKQFVVCSQNHDQIGNRMRGDRLATLLAFEQQKLLAAAVLLSPFIPMLFMGEEYGETAPFQFFVNHTDADLLEATRKGRFEEFAAFAWKGDVPDPAAEATFQRSKLNHALASQGHHRVLRDFYRKLITLRKQLPAIGGVEKETMETMPFETEKVLLVRQWHGTDEIVLVFNFANEPRAMELPFPPGEWRKQLDSAAPDWGGPGMASPMDLQSSGLAHLEMPPASAILFQKNSKH